MRPWGPVFGRAQARSGTAAVARGGSRVGVAGIGDHGGAGLAVYLSDHFLKQIRYWGIHPSFGFVEEPETNGVAERWNRTLKEQAIHGRIFQNLEAVRAAVADFVERYNQTWRLEKLGYQTPIEGARSMCYARRHSTNVCPGNRVRYSFSKSSYSIGSCAPGFSWTLDERDHRRLQAKIGELLMEWRDQFLAAGQAGLKSRTPDARDDDHRRLQAKIGALLMETELLYAKVDQLEAGGPLARRRSTR